MFSLNLVLTSVLRVRFNTLFPFYLLLGCTEHSKDLDVNEPLWTN